MKRRTFIKDISLISVCALLPVNPIKAAETVKKTSADAFKSQAGFTLWQLPSMHNDIGNSYVLLTNKGRIVVMDGGTPKESLFLRGFLNALGNEVEAWFISHPHNDHMGALKKILSEIPDGNCSKINIHKIYHSRFSPEHIRTEKGSDELCNEFYQLLDTSGIPVADLHEPGFQLQIDGLNLKILSVTNEEFNIHNTYNNSSMIIRAWDKKKSVVFLADSGKECGNKALNGPLAKDLNCDYLQVAHHGQKGCDEHFYKTVKFRACLWPTPIWIWNNDEGKGFNTGSLKTFETRGWMDEIGIKEHHVSGLDGVWRLD